MSSCMIIINENIKTLMSLSENVSDWAVGSPKLRIILEMMSSVILLLKSPIKLTKLKLKVEIRVVVGTLDIIDLHGVTGGIHKQSNVTFARV